MWIPAWVVEHLLSTMCAGAVKTFLVLVLHANTKGETFVGEELIAKTIGGTVRSVRRHLRTLEKQQGLIKRMDHKKGGKGHKVKYKLFTQKWLDYRKRHKKNAK